VNDAQLLSSVERYYTGKVREHGATPEGVDWNGAHSQEVRFDQLLAVAAGIEGELSVLDYGCGYGALVDALAARRGDRFRYQGYDVSEAMIEEARKRTPDDPRIAFTADAAALQPADVTIASGIFNVRLETPEDEWQRYIEDTLDCIVALSRRGIAFNALTSHSDPDRMRAYLHYADPAQLLDHCLRRYSRDVALRHDYELYEFTLLVRLDARPPAHQETPPA
jgi:SAM-dependent methyltransferase